MKIIKDYQNLFEKLRNNSLKFYGLCPSHYLSALCLSCNAMLKITKIKLELISDPDMSKSIEKSVKSEFLIFLINIAKPTITI